MSVAFIMIVCLWYISITTLRSESLKVSDMRYSILTVALLGSLCFPAVADQESFEQALNKLPTIADWAIDGGTLIVFPAPAHQHNARAIARVVCIGKKANNVTSFELIRMMDSIKRRCARTGC